METGNKDKKIGVFAYECIGTALITAALIIQDGSYYGLGCFYTTVAMMCIAWNVSGGHFNPAISLGMFVAEKKWGSDLFPLLIMVGGQFVGAFVGILFGWMAVEDSDYQEKQTGQGESSHATVPSNWINFTAFLPLDAEKSVDDGMSRDPITRDWSNDDFTRNWQCFWATIICSFLLVLFFISVKHKSTQLTDDSLIQILAISTIFLGVAVLNVEFGGAGFNPALACGYISLAVSQYAYPNILPDSEYKLKYGFDPSAIQINHYLWVFMIAPFVGGFAAGIVHLIHQKCSNKQGSDNDENAE